MVIVLRYFHTFDTTCDINVLFNTHLPIKKLISNLFKKLNDGKSKNSGC